MRGLSCSRRRNDRLAGFTLIEVLAALVVTGMLVMVALPLVGLLVENWWTGEAEIANGDAWMQAVARLSDDVAQALPIPLANGDRKDVAFQASETTIRLVRPSLGARGANELEIVSIAIRPSPAGDRLVRDAQPFEAGRFRAHAAAPKGAAELLHGPYHLRFAAVAMDGRRHSEWNSEKTLPKRIEMSVTALSRSRVPAAPIVMPIAAASAEDEGARQ